MKRFLLVTVGGLVVASVALAGCASSSSTSPSASSTPSESIGTVLPPIPISKGGAVTAKVGDNLNVITPGVTKVETDTPTVLEVSQPYNDGSAQFNGGAKVIAAGNADLIVRGENNITLYTVNVTATN